jgi:hypothetical protein
VIPQHSEPELGYSSGDSRQGYSQQILLRIVLGGLSGTGFELFGGGLISSMNESTPMCIERFGEFEILRVGIRCGLVTNIWAKMRRVRMWGIWMTAKHSEQGVGRGMPVIF